VGGDASASVKALKLTYAFFSALQLVQKLEIPRGWGHRHNPPLHTSFWQEAGQGRSLQNRYLLTTPLEPPAAIAANPQVYLLSAAMCRTDGATRALLQCGLLTWQGQVWHHVAAPASCPWRNFLRSRIPERRTDATSCAACTFAHLAPAKLVFRARHAMPGMGHEAAPMMSRTGGDQLACC
jgi:hypothetical protein